MDVSRGARKHPVPNYLLRRAREQRGWSHRDVADRIDLPDAHTVGRWERGIQFPQPHYRQALCRIFGKSAEELGLLKEKSSEEQALFESPQFALQSRPLWKIPTPLTSFIGRQSEIAAVRQLLERSDVRLVTLLGPGGVGKTRLSVQAATVMREHFVDGACFISLATVRDPALVIPAIAKELGVQEHATFPVLEQVKMFLSEKCFLLLLDNFEQVVTAGSIVEEILASCSGLKVVVTSRMVLHLQGEHEFPVQPLTLPELKHYPVTDEVAGLPSVALFVQRAQAVQPNFAVTAENVYTIAEICVHLNGLPLAIELAAAHIKLLPPQALLERLTQSLWILKSEQSTLPERQQTLYRTFQWSYDLLNEQEKELFEQLAVFRGSCTLEAIEMLFGVRLGETRDILSLVRSLLDKSLLYRQERESKQLRFNMLEVIREYGLNILRMQRKLEQCQQRHATYYQALLEKAEPHLKDEQQAQWLLYFEQELENLRAALNYFITAGAVEQSLRFCEIFGKFCGLQGYWREEMRWLKAVLALPVAPEHRAMRARILRRAGHLAYRLRDLAAARALQEESVVLSGEVGDKQNLAGALSGLGWTLYRQKHVAATAHLLKESVVAARESGDQWAIANALESLGRFFYSQGKIEEAYQLVEESITLARKLGDKESLARILTTYTSIEIAQHHLEQAAQSAQEALTLAQELGAKPLTALVLDCLGDIVLFHGDYEEALCFIGDRIALAQELYDQPAIALKQLQVGAIALARGDLTQATALIQESLAFFRKQEDIPNIASALHLFADIKRAQGNFAQAMDQYKEALALDRDIGNTRKIAQHLLGMAMIASAQGDFEGAVLLLGGAESFAQSGVALSPITQKEYERVVAQVRAHLGEQEFAAALAKGRAITIDQVLAL